VIERRADESRFGPPGVEKKIPSPKKGRGQIS